MWTTPTWDGAAARERETRDLSCARDSVSPSVHRWAGLRAARTLAAGLPGCPHPRDRDGRDGRDGASRERGGSPPPPPPYFKGPTYPNPGH